MTDAAVDTALEIAADGTSLRVAATYAAREHGCVLEQQQIYAAAVERAGGDA